MNNHASQVICQIHLDEPNVDLAIFKNFCINDLKIRINENMRGKVNVPSMYRSWTEEPRNHLSFDWIDKSCENNKENSKSLLIFDTWGTSSYYHLLVDHILPVWITREWLRENFGFENEYFEYYRISKNNYAAELASSQDIFSYFLGSNYLESAEGAYRNIIYGYFYNYRPYLGPRHPIVEFTNYRHWLAKFRRVFGKFVLPNTDAPILVPLRITRNTVWVDRFLQKYSHRVNFKAVDFGCLTIDEQIILSGSARGIFGNEGAAFANMIFMPNDSLILPVASESDRFLFHSTLSKYIPHQFKPILIDSFGNSDTKDDDVLKFFERSS